MKMYEFGALTITDPCGCKNLIFKFSIWRFAFYWEFTFECKSDDKRIDWEELHQLASGREKDYE